MDTAGRLQIDKPLMAELGRIRDAGKPIEFEGVGEGVDALDTADPQRLAGRILQMGDVVGLVERAQAAISEEEQAKLAEKALRTRGLL